MRKHIAIVVLFVLAALVGAAASDGGVAIKFPRSVVGLVQHGNLLVVVNYQKDPRNREIELLWDSVDSEGESGSSSAVITAESDGIPFAKDLQIAPGQYLFRATLYRSDGSKLVDIQNRMVTK